MPKGKVALFFEKHLGKILHILKTNTQKLFIPVSLTDCPASPVEHAFIVLRNSENVTAFSLDNWFTSSIPQLCQKFVVKSYKINPTNGIEDVRD